MTSPIQSPTLKKVASFWIIEDKPECKTPLDQKIQEVIKPALLVEDSHGKKSLLFLADSSSPQDSSRDGSPLIDLLLKEYPK